ncbi:MAG: hypothetical protein MJZ22_00510 [Candidatus Saccharibacteria bacterium]|nr:hypothetical protein [Candidatus Saccharibacteria bacterium]
MKKITTISMALAAANAFAISPQVKNADDAYDILGRQYDKVSASRVINTSSATAQNKFLMQNDKEEHVFPALRKAKDPDENTLAVGVNPSFAVRETKGPYSVPSKARKDTKMLVLGWGKHALDRDWSHPHDNHPMYDEEEAYRCWIVAAQELNRAIVTKKGGLPSGKNYLTQDEIKYRVFHKAGNLVSDFPFITAGGGDASRMEAAISKAIGVSSGVKVYERTEFDEYAATHDVKAEVLSTIAGGFPAYIGEGDHVMLADAYVVDYRGDAWIRLLNPDNNGSFQWRKIKSVDFGLIATYPKTGLTAIYSDSRILKDSDEDGICDFDEIVRFGTNPNLWDTDGDYESDYDEILNYTLKHIPPYITDSKYEDLYTSALNTSVVGNMKEEIWADPNKDGIRQEKDHGNSLGNTLPLYVEKDVPGKFVIYALNNLTMGAGSKCKLREDVNGPTTTGCDVAAAGTSSNYAVNFGTERAGVYETSIYTKGGVKLTSSAVAKYIHIFRYSHEAPTKESGAVISQFWARENPDAWPWQVGTDVGSISVGTTALTVPSGATVTLKNGSKYYSVRVDKGGTLLFEPGEIYVGNINVKEGATVGFTKTGSATTLHVRTGVTWMGQLKKSGLDDAVKAAKYFRLISHGSSKVTINSGWAGTLFAPNSEVNLGSNGARIVGRFVGKNVSVAAGADVVGALYLGK